MKQSRITFAAQAGTTIFFQVGGHSADTGNLTFTVAEAPLPPNDNFADASPIASLPFTSSLSTDAATSEAGEPSPCGSIAKTVWYSFTPGADVSITANTFGSDYDTVLAAYTGTSLSNLTRSPVTIRPGKEPVADHVRRHGRNDGLHSRWVASSR